MTSKKIFLSSEILGLYCILDQPYRMNAENLDLFLEPGIAGSLCAL
jgi:hypothetical protein